MCNIKKYGQVFTPIDICEELICDIDFEDSSLRICEPCFGDGRILLMLKERLLEYHSEEHIISNMLYGIEIQEELYALTLSKVNPRGYKHNLYNMSALTFQTDSQERSTWQPWLQSNPLKEWVGTMTHVVGNPPYNRNIAKKGEVDKMFWDPSGYTTKLAYCFFVVLANYLLEKGGALKYVMPCSFTHNENTISFREFLKDGFDIKKIKILSKDAFKGIMIRTCIFDAVKGRQTDKIFIERVWNDKKYRTTTFYNEYNEIPLFIGDVSKEIYNKVMKNRNTLLAFKGWNGADSYAKFISKDPDEYEYKYVHGVDRKGQIQVYSSQYADKFKAKKNKKRNNVGNYNRLGLNKIIINEVMFNSFEAKSHIKYILIDRDGKFGVSPKNTIICMEKEKIDHYVKDLQSKITQLIFTIMKDYNHNDSKLFRYVPFGISETTLTEEEREFLNSFAETSNEVIHELIE